MDYKIVLRMNPNYGTESIGDILDMCFFVSKNGYLEQIYLIERNGRKVLWSGYTSKSTKAFAEFSNSQLIDVFKKLALANPSDFRKLYEEIRNGDSRVFNCIETARKQVKAMFNFT